MSKQIVSQGDYFLFPKAALITSTFHCQLWVVHDFCFISHLLVSPQLSGFWPQWFAKIPFAMNWIAYPPNLDVDAPTPNAMVLKEALWEIIRFRWGQEGEIYEGSQCLIRRDSSELVRSLCLEQPASWVICKPGSEPHYVSSLISDLKPPQPWEN